MYEKISEEEIRREKVEKVKNKILSEMYERLYVYKRRIQQNTEISDEEFDYCVRKSFALLELKKYLLNDNCFMSYETKYGDEDIVIYMVSEKELNIWAQKNYNFVFNFLHKVEENEYNVYPLLNDRFFGYNFTDAFDHILYDKREEGTDMEFTEMDEVRVKTYGGAIGTIEKVVYEIVDGKKTDNVYCYEMKINGKHGIIIYPDEIDE